MKRPLPDHGYPVQPGLRAPGKSIDTQLMMESSKYIKFNSLDFYILLLRENVCDQKQKHGVIFR